MIYDISQPVFDCAVYPGDPAPQRTMLSRMDDGDGYNLTAFSMCAHNGTHVDAPLHFLKDGKGVGAVALEKFIGPAYVGTMCGDVGEREAKELLERAKKHLLRRAEAHSHQGRRNRDARSGERFCGRTDRSDRR